MRAVAAHLDDIPTPDYSDYFHAIAAHPEFEDSLSPTLLAESSRSCWWGKSTLLRLLLGFERPMAGAVFFDGQVWPTWT